MLQAIRNLFAPSVGMKMVIRGRVLENSYHIAVQKIVRSTGARGSLQVFGPSRYMVLELEGPKPRMEWLVEAIRQKANTDYITGLELSWSPNTGKLGSFRVRQ